MKSLRESVLARSLRLLSKSDRSKLALLTLIQIFLSFMDLLGIALFGILGSLAVSGIESKNPSGKIYSILKYLGIDHRTLQYQVAIIGLLAAGALLTRTFSSIFFTQKTMYFLSRRGVALSEEIIGRLYSQDLIQIQKRTFQETIFALTTGVNTVIVGIISAFVSLLSDGVLLLVMLIGLIFVDSLLAVVLVAFFGLIGLILYKLMHQRMKNLGLENAKLTISTNELLMESLESYRESTVRNRRPYYVREISEVRYNQAAITAKIYFMPLISKYVIESAVVLCGLLLGAVQFTLRDASHAVGTLSIFLAASARIAPAVLRVQQGSLGIRGAHGSATPTLELIESLEGIRSIDKKISSLDLEHRNFKGEVKVSNLNFIYPENLEETVKDLHLNISEGETVAIVGSSGAGKTTLVDLILGVIKPTSGEILISGINPQATVEKWPGAISYVPQNVAISNGTIRENVALGYSPSQTPDQLVWESLESANLKDFVENLPDGLNTQVGERGTKLSGGQRQRLGIARALFTKPKLLILDEATSSLDGQTEAEITKAINKLKGRCTIIVIAHRLSTVKNADSILYLEKGQILAKGSFEELRRLVPNFELHAKLAGY